MNQKKNVQGSQKTYDQKDKVSLGIKSNKQL